MTHTSARLRHSGIVTFVGVLFVVVGAYNALSGVVALVKDDWYASDELLFGDLAAWGIWWIIIGAVQLFASYEILNRREFGFYLGIGLAGVMFLVGAASNAAYGVAALADDGRFQDEQLVVGELALWGGFSLPFAAIQLVTGLLLLRGRTAGVVLGAVIALLHGTGTLMVIGAYPLWSVIVLIVDGLILYGLLAYSAADSGRRP